MIHVRDLSFGSTSHIGTSVLCITSGKPHGEKIKISLEWWLWHWCERVVFSHSQLCHRKAIVHMTSDCKDLGFTVLRCLSLSAGRGISQGPSRCSHYAYPTVGTISQASLLSKLCSVAWNHGKFTSRQGTAGEKWRGQSYSLTTESVVGTDKWTDKCLW